MQKTASLLMAALFTYAALTLASSGAPPDADPAATNEKSAVEDKSRPEEALRRMADYLGNLPAFSCHVNAVFRMQAQGMDNRMEMKMTVRLERPNRLAVILEEGVMGMTIVSDGKKVTQYLPMMNRYAVKDAPADFSKLNDESGAMGMTGMSGVMIPTSGEEFYKALIGGVTKSEYLGEEKIGDVMCPHCRFHRQDFSWEIWIESGDRPLVHKIVPDLSKQLGEAAGMLKDAKLEYSIALSDWNVQPKFTDADFAFTPPADAQKVDSLFEALAGGDDAEEEEGPHALLGQPAPTFETVDVEGQAIDLDAHLGKSVIMLDFWATWCGPCVEAMPQVDAVAKKFADRGLVFYAVNVSEDAETVKEFLKTSELDLPVAMDADGKINELYLVNGIPQTVLVGKDGKVQVVHVGYSDKLGELLTKQVEDLLAGKDLASETLAEAEKAREKRHAQIKKYESVGAAQQWTASGRYGGVGVHAESNTLYAAGSPKGIAVMDASGNIQQEIAINEGDTMRLANLAGDAAPELVLFQSWGPSVKAYDVSGNSLWDYSLGQGVDDVWPADVDGDGMDEVIIGYNGGTGLHVLDHRGTPLWKFTDIGNVWHVTAGDFNDDDKVEVVTTSAQGDMHVFDTEGQKVKDIDVSIYASMVRMAKLGDGASLAIVCGSGDAGEAMIAVDFAGEEKWTLDLPHLEVDHVDDLAIAATMPWAAAAMRGGLIHVVDLDAERIIARVSDQGMRPQVAWLPRKDQSPLLIVATGRDLNAFEITPTDLNEVEDANQTEDAEDSSDSSSGSDDESAEASAE